MGRGNPIKKLSFPFRKILRNLSPTRLHYEVFHNLANVALDFTIALLLNCRYSDVFLFFLTMVLSMDNLMVGCFIHRWKALKLLMI